MATRMKCLFALTFLLVMFCRGVKTNSPADGRNGRDVKNALKMSNKELESFLRKKATTTIDKMRKQFKDAYTKFVSTKATAKKVKAEHKLEALIDQANANVKEDIKHSTQGLKVQIKPLHGKESLQAMVSVERRTKRTSGSGTCRPVCLHMCLPSCNLACCVPPPNDNLTKEDIEKMVDLAAWKMSRKKDNIARVTHKVSGKNAKKAKEKSSTVSDEEETERHISKEDMEKGEMCNATCRMICLPSCKFKCCITTYTIRKNN